MKLFIWFQVLDYTTSTKEIVDKVSFFQLKSSTILQLKNNLS